MCTCVYMCICMHGHNAWFEFLNCRVVPVKLGRLCVFFKSLKMCWHMCMPWWSAGECQSRLVKYCGS